MMLIFFCLPNVIGIMYHQVAMPNEVDNVLGRKLLPYYSVL